MKPHINKLLDATNQFGRETRKAFNNSDSKEDLENNYGQAILNLKSNLELLGLKDHFNWADEVFQENEPLHLGDTDPFKEEN